MFRSGFVEAIVCRFDGKSQSRVFAEGVAKERGCALQMLHAGDEGAVEHDEMWELQKLVPSGRHESRLCSESITA